MSSTSVRLPNELVEEARKEARVYNRTVSGQIEHWVKLGRTVETTPGFTLDRVRAAFEQRFDPDDLTAAEREIFEDLRGAAMDAPSKAKDDFLAELRQRTGTVGYDERGRLVRTLPDGGVEVLEE
ncbi:TA system antitoxin ParD family protein [Arhodomonas sp. AD133]|uniref:TA system antitoxin ParD family protein n=1 Tax=Arhodomonas sp. AD133 TaxID=3415009 RepID=UPI003EC0E997